MTKKAIILSITLSIMLGVGPTKEAKASGIPVIDVANLQQNAVDALEAVAQTLKQIEQYILQLQQYENMITNTLAPFAYVWAKAIDVMNAATSLQNSVTNIIENSGDLDAYLEKYKNLNTYRNSPYFGRMDGGTAEQITALQEAEETSAEMQKAANDAAFKALQAEQASIQSDASTLETLQGYVGGALGRMQAAQFTNQLMAQQANQLLQLRANLVAIWTAETVRNQAVADREAKQMALREVMVETRYKASDSKTWSVR